MLQFAVPCRALLVLHGLYSTDTMYSRSPWGHLSFLSLVSFLLLLPAPSCHGGKVLVFPVDGSHWINMKVLIEELHARGHTITVVRPSTSWYITEESPLYTSITIKEKDNLYSYIETFLQNQLKAQREGISLLKFFQLTKEFLSMIEEAHILGCELLARIFDDKELMKSLQEAQYDMMLTDPNLAGGLLMAHYLKLPVVLNARWITSGEGHFAIAPSPLSYIPITGSGFTDKMTFVQRVQNMLHYSIIMYQQRFVVGPIYDAICAKYFEGGCDIISLIQEADIWLMRSDFVFDFPRPTMPNVVYMGGFQCKPAQPLPPDLEEFVQSAGEHGVIVMSLGTLVNALPVDITDQIASVFAKLPQKVIWRHRGKRPSTLGNNTLLVDWMPQKDLLGHPQTRAFVAHGGTNGVQEAIYHGTPVLGIPLFFDQYDNLLRLQERGAAKILELAMFNGPSFQQALNQVLTHAPYRENMQRLSRLHRDQPIKPMDKALFWLEFVMRHKGASHLRTSANRMPWYSYHSVDVLLLLLAAGGGVLLFTGLLIRILWRTCRKNRNKTKQH
uniref:UDP-glucuronosyltransferase 2C1-like isoform X1 n=2 Tax=Oncorhynchus gorbuscha TaxID=8017 RepID=UPI001EAEF736|nr:UDP-glucuronosyltransferase 2C1-like isoform X1 [Oncorhynchus gorbuscha]